MEAFFNAIFYITVFAALYVQVFLLFVFLERRKEMKPREHVELTDFPSVDIIVPCWNEEKTLDGTVTSLLALDYPKDKIRFHLVDDGSTDSTWSVMQKYAGNPQIEIIRKENGGKHTAVNLGIDSSSGQFVACLDADSFVAPDALKRMLTYFKDPKIMAVSPTVIVHRPKNVIELAQKADYTMAAYIKKMFASVNGMHVASGSFTVFRREVFEKIGKYKKAHNTEDFEITLRMYQNGMQINQCNDAFVYTTAPNTVRKLFKQRLRWMFGFIENVKDYRGLLFRKKYGPVALITLPAGVISIFGVIYLFGMMLYDLIKKIVDIVLYWHDTGILHIGRPHFDPFFLNTGSTFFLIAILYIMVGVSFMLGKRVYGKKPVPSIDLLYFFIVYSVVAPLWLLRAIYNSLTRAGTAWR